MKLLNLLPNTSEFRDWRDYEMNVVETGRNDLTVGDFEIETNDHVDVEDPQDTRKLVLRKHRTARSPQNDKVVEDEMRAMGWTPDTEYCLRDVFDDELTFHQNRPRVYAIQAI